MTEKYDLIDKIITEVSKLDVMWFIKEEIEDSLDYLNKYKLMNIYENIEAFCQDIQQVNKNYIKSLKS